MKQKYWSNLTWINVTLFSDVLSRQRYDRLRDFGLERSRVLWSSKQDEWPRSDVADADAGLDVDGVQLQHFRIRRWHRRKTERTIGSGKNVFAIRSW